MATLKEIETLAETAERACEHLRDTLQEYFDDKTDSWQDGDRGDFWRELIDYAEQAYDACNSARPSNV